MRRILLGAAGLAVSTVHAQTVPPAPTQTPDVQTGRSADQAPPAAPASSDPHGITPADSGSAVDKPAPVEAMPRTGYHAPVIPQPAEAPAHARLRDIRPPVFPAEGASQNADALRPLDQRGRPAGNGR